MKRFLTIAAVAALAVFALSSCGNKENPDKKAQFDHAIVTAKYFINKDLDEAADVTLNITTFKGTKMPMPVSTTQQVIDIEKYSGNLPAEFSFQFAATPKTDLKKDSYNCSLTYEITVKVYDSKGNVKKSKTSKDELIIDDKKDNVAWMLERFNRAGAKFVINEDMSIDEKAL